MTDARAGTKSETPRSPLPIELPEEALRAALDSFYGSWLEHDYAARPRVGMMLRAFLQALTPSQLRELADRMEDGNG